MFCNTEIVKKPFSSCKVFGIYKRVETAGKIFMIFQ